MLLDLMAINVKTSFSLLGLLTDGHREPILTIQQLRWVQS